MNFLQVVILSVVQGLTEFLPVSSSGHLVILQKFFNLPSPPVLFDILVHVGTLGSILFYFRKNLFKLFKNWQKNLHLFWLIILGTIPVAVIGGLFEGQIKATFDSLQVVAFSLLVTAALLFSTKWVKVGNRQFSARGQSASGGRQLKWQDGLFVGLFQALALLPGVSRSGSTIAASLIRKADRETAFRFSFYLAIPAIAGALVLQIPDLIFSAPGYLEQGFLGMVTSGVVGFFALKALERVLRQARLFWFGFYCLILGSLLLLL